MYRHLEGGQLSLVRTLVDIDGQCEVDDREVLYIRCAGGGQGGAGPQDTLQGLPGHTARHSSVYLTQLPSISLYCPLYINQLPSTVIPTCPTEIYALSLVNP